ncbi:class I SAM-dependent methyltransferase [Paenibacillus sp. NEAU-GSW1]|uniref:class I SAM-dependent methyltransferase n=1 Tax=Paenibacillus sp. NEAU-GSW1 TaxID=2682486 RepID=UPI0012E1EBA4|nr:class I SAM-dependent methyltransferase [Paenibacillus sp. NEAU-GSW1]MUT67309.1 SAM-dependent methyltransferase [Paenibacillus sp. NEAU-GSW1]
MIVTTSDKPSPAAYAQARRLADELGAAFKPRGRNTLRQLAAANEEALQMLVVTEREVRFYDGQTDSPLFFHPSMAFVRVKRLRKGESDPLIELSGCREGDRIVDCTAGLGSDSLVFSYAAGAKGSVIALESEPVLCALVREGLASYQSGLDDVDAAMRRIEMINANHLDYLKGLPDKSVDIVYFDPMFRQPIHESSAIQPLRSLANAGALSEEAVAEALRAARKTVLLKEHKESGEYARLGFRKTHVNTSKIAYGVIEVASHI